MRAITKANRTSNKAKASLLSGLLSVACLLGLFGATAVYSNTVKAASVNVEELNKKLAPEARWVAKDNWVSNLSFVDRKKMLGLKTPVRHDLYVTKQPSGLNPMGAPLPASIDWRNQNGKNYVSPILNQGQCGSCVAFATVATFETQLNISNALPNLDVRLSPEALFMCGGGTCDGGWDPDSATQYLQQSGIPDEACMPYTSGATGKDVACSTACSDSASRSFKINSADTPSSESDINAVKQALQKGPLVTTLTVYADFPTYSSGVYKHVTGDVEGGHAVSIVGYDDSKNAWIVRNSWGTDWGDHGFVYVDYDDTSGVSQQNWAFDPAVNASAIGLATPRDYDYFSTSMAPSAVFTDGKFASVSYKIFDTKGHLISTTNVSTTVGGTQPQINTKGMADGQYVAQVVGLDTNGKEVDHSTPKMFFVLNSKPTISLAYAGTNGTDLGQPASGVISLGITSHSDPVPMNSMELHILRPDGTTKIDQLGVPADSMVVQMDTTTKPNGAYQVWFVGQIQFQDGTSTTYESAHTTINIKN